MYSFVQIMFLKHSYLDDTEDERSARKESQLRQCVGAVFAALIGTTPRSNHLWYMAYSIKELKGAPMTDIVVCYMLHEVDVY